MSTPIYRLLPIVATWWALSEVVATITYDEYMTCGSGGGRYGRQYHQHSEMPCDLSKETFCITPGNQYPWSSVRRFVLENQGLMKRMYGNQRHYNVLRAEFLHELYEEMFDEMPVRQRHRFRPPSPSSSPSSRTARYQTHSNANSLHMEKLTKSEMKEAGDQPRERSRAIKIISAEPPAHLGHRRRQQVSSSSSYSTSSRTSSSSSSSSTMPKTRLKKPENRVKPTGLPSIKEAPTSPSDETSTTVTGQATRTNTRRPQTTPLTNFPSDPTTFTTDGEITTTDGTDGSFLREANGETTTSDEGLYLAEEYESGTFEPTFFPPHSLDDLDLFDDDDLWTTLEDRPLGTYSTPPTYSSEFSESTLSTVGQEMFTLTPGTPEDFPDNDPGYGTDEDYPQTFTSTVSDRDGPTTLGGPPKALDEAATEAYGHERTETNPGFQDSMAKNSNSVKQEELREAAAPSSEAPVKDLEAERRETVPMVNGVVHKDVLEDVKEDDPPPEPVITKRPLRGVNACPVKEEFVAPYWANNTRGETLALLNLYPFEQYIQWERCMYEHRQMYCRKGCRCEQQYRLHKLLAFDPRNECKGIFSDWFRFPSCCVCKCYDLPQELFSTSARRPRYRFEQSDEYEDDYTEDEDEDDYETDGEDDFENRVLEDDASNDNEDDDHETEEEEDGDEDKVRQRYLVRSGGRMVNIPPQRRPRQPPRPASHITTLRATSSSPDVVKDEDSESTSRRYKMATTSDSTSPSPPPMSTLGTLDAATPHYYYNISHHARILLANSRPFPLSRIPRSNEP